MTPHGEMADAFASARRLARPVAIPPVPTLADAIVALLLAEPDGLPCEKVARLLHRRTAAVLDVLRADPRFVTNGEPTKARRWTLTTHGREGKREGIGREATRDPDRVDAPHVSGPEIAVQRAATEEAA